MPSGRSRVRYTAEFKADAVAMVIDAERSIVDVARGLGLVEQTLGDWVRQARIDRGERAGLTSEDRGELVRLRRENAQLVMERHLLQTSNGFLGEGVEHCDPLQVGQLPESRGIPGDHGVHGCWGVDDDVL